MIASTMLYLHLKVTEQCGDATITGGVVICWHSQFSTSFAAGWQAAFTLQTLITTQNQLHWPSTAEVAMHCSHCFSQVGRPKSAQVSCTCHCTSSISVLVNSLQSASPDIKHQPHFMPRLAYQLPVAGGCRVCKTWDILPLQ